MLAGADIRYRLVDLGQIPGFGFYQPIRVTDQSEVLGTASKSTTLGGIDRSFAGQSLSVRSLLTPVPGATSSLAYGIAMIGFAAGYSEWFQNGPPPPLDFSIATMWDAGRNPHILGPIPMFESKAFDIRDDAREIVGDFDGRPAAWESNSGLTFLPGISDTVFGNYFMFGTATRVNRAGNIVGTLYDFISPPQSVGVEWDRLHRPTPIGSLSGPLYSPADVNAQGQVVGSYQGKLSDFLGNHDTHAFTWSRQIGVTMLPPLVKNSYYDVAEAINSQGQIVGSSSPFAFGIFGTTYAVLWENNRIVDLNTLIQYTGYVLYTADSINDKGEICGIALTEDYNSGEFTQHVYLLKPLH